MLSRCYKSNGEAIKYARNQLHAFLILSSSDVESILAIAMDNYPTVDNDSLETFLVINWAGTLQQLVRQKKEIQKNLLVGELTAAL